MLPAKRKRVTKSKKQLLDEAVERFLKQSIDNNIPINGPLLQGKALKFAKELKEFQQRHQIKHEDLTGDTASGHDSPTLSRNLLTDEEIITAIQKENDELIEGESNAENVPSTSDFSAQEALDTIENELYKIKNVPHEIFKQYFILKDFVKKHIIEAKNKIEE